MEDIVFATVDSLRYDHVGAYGYHRDTTPFFDSLAEDGHVFERVYAHAPATRVSFPAMMTSSSPLMYGGFEQISPDRTLVAEVLDSVGYQTGGFHSNLFLSDQFGYGRGFDTFYDSRTDPSLLAKLRTKVRNTLKDEGRLYQFLKWAFNRTEQHAGIELGSLYTKADAITDMGIEWLNGLDRTEPSFCWVHYMDVHHPYVPPAEYQREFRDEPIDDRTAVKLRYKMLEEPEAVTDAELQQLIDLYDAEIRFTDAQIERLVSAARSQLDDPVVVVTADHGEQFREHDGFSHGSAYEEGVRVPLVINDGKGAGHYEELVGLEDLAPTFVDYAQATMPETFHGYSLQSVMEGAQWDREYVIGEYGDYPDEYYGFYTDGEWKYIDSDEHGVQLYNLLEDPAEQRNVIDDHPEVVEDIEMIIDCHQTDIDATSRDIGDTEMDDEVVDRLEQLGYKME